MKVIGGHQPCNVKQPYNKLQAFQGQEENLFPMLSGFQLYFKSKAKLKQQILLEESVRSFNH